MSNILDNLINKINKTYGDGIIRYLNDETDKDIEVVSSGSFSLDLALGVGGYPRGRIVEMFGPEGGGKTTLAIHAIAEAQKEGLKAVFIDAEHAFDPLYAENIGVNLNELLITQPDNGEQALEITEELVRSQQVGIIVIDSVAALTPKVEIEGLMGDATVAVQARLMSKAMRKLNGPTKKSGCILIFINQLREKVGIIFGSPITTTGGNALKFYASIRLDISRKGFVKKGETDTTGSRTRVKVVKNKVAPPFKIAEFDIAYGRGVDKEGEILDYAVEMDIVKLLGGGWYVHKENKLGQGRPNVIDLLRDNREFYDELQNGVQSKLIEVDEKEEKTLNDVDTEATKTN